MEKWMRNLLVLILLTTSSPVVRAQYGANWPTQPPTPMATEVPPGKQVVRVSGVNDFLYQYEINVIEITTPTPINLPGGAAVTPCNLTEVTTLTTDVQSAYSAFLKLFPDSATPSKTLLQSQNEWKTSVKPAYDKLDGEIAAALAAVDALPPDQAGQTPTKRFCKAAVDSQKKIYDDVLKKGDTKLNQGSHTVEASIQVKNCKSEILTITEKYKGTPTGQSVRVQLDAECDQVTVAGGVLLSEIQNRTYTPTLLPGQTGQFLSVGGTGKFHPTLVVLTSFNLPFEPLGHRVATALGDARVGLSVGPVVQGSKSDVSSFGWFFGGSVSFLHRLYISPGFHTGEFADFPPGFVASQQIPSNFGALTPVKRWTTRFGIGITIKGWDASKAFKGGQDQPTPTPKK